MDTWRDRLRRRLEELKDQEGLSQAAIAERIGCAPGSITNWLNGHREPRELADFERLAHGLGVHPAWLLYGVNTDDPEVLDLLSRMSRLSAPTRQSVRRIIDDLTA